MFNKLEDSILCFNYLLNEVNDLRSLGVVVVGVHRPDNVNSR